MFLLYFYWCSFVLKIIICMRSRNAKREKRNTMKKVKTAPIKNVYFFTLRFVVHLFLLFHSGFRLIKRHVKCQKYIFISGVSLIDFTYKIFQIIIVMWSKLIDAYSSTHTQPPHGIKELLWYGQVTFLFPFFLYFCCLRTMHLSCACVCVFM